MANWFVWNKWKLNKTRNWKTQHDSEFPSLPIGMEAFSFYGRSWTWVVPSTWKNHLNSNSVHRFILISWPRRLASLRVCWLQRILILISSANPFKGCVRKPTLRPVIHLRPFVLSLIHTASATPCVIRSPPRTNHSQDSFDNPSIRSPRSDITAETRNWPLIPLSPGNDHAPPILILPSETTHPPTKKVKEFVLVQISEEEDHSS